MDNVVDRLRSAHAVVVNKIDSDYYGEAHNIRFSIVHRGDRWNCSVMKIPAPLSDILGEHAAFSDWRSTAIEAADAILVHFKSIGLGERCCPRKSNSVPSSPLHETNPHSRR